MRSSVQNIFSTAAHKLLQFPGELEKWQSRRRFIPVTLEIQPSEKCNHRCPDCQARYTMPLEQVRLLGAKGSFLDLLLLESVWSAPPRGIVVSGNTGDPLLHPNIVDLLERAASLTIPVVLITNGQALTPEIAAAAVRSCTGIRISLDAFDALSARRTHGVCADAWRAILNGVQTLVCEKRKSNRQQCLLGVGYLTREDTLSGMLPAAHLAKSLGVDYIQFRPFHYHTCAIDEELKKSRELESSSFRVMASYPKYDNVNSFFRPYRECHGAWFYTVVDARGDFYICCHHVGRPEARLGSLTTQSWTDFLDSRQRKEALTAFSVTGCLPYCRLHPHNVALEQIHQNRSYPQPQVVSEEITRHAPFL